MFRLVAACAVAAGLAACQTGPRAPGGEMFMSDTQIQAKDDQECRGYGVAPGSNAYVACRMNLQQSRSNAALAQQDFQARNFRTGAMLLR